MPQRHDEDIDDIMSSILQRQRGSAPSYQPQAQPRRKKKPQQHPVPKPRPSILDEPAPAYTSVSKTPPRPRRKLKLKKSVKIGLSVAIVVLILGGLIFAFRKPLGSAIGNLLAPPSPFSQEVREKAGFPLFYPTKLPGSFKIESDSVKQPESGVVIYAITDDDGKRININLQKQPEGINLDPLYNVLEDIQELDTKFGKVKTGVSTESVQITNILTGKTWIIVNAAKDTLTQDELIKLINNLREVNP